jgi:hypothetical protein
LRPKIAFAEDEVKEQEEGAREVTMMYDRKRNRQILGRKGVEMNVAEKRNTSKTQGKKAFEISTNLQCVHTFACVPFSEND